MTYSTIAIIYNPNSTGSSDNLAKDFKSAIHKALPKQKVELIATTHAGHGEELAYSIAMSSKNPLIISSSGDGGYNEIINGAMRAQSKGAHPTTGLLPGGNANDHYRNLHDKDILDAIIENKDLKIDLLTLKGYSNSKRITRYGHSYIGFGFTPSIAQELNKAKLNIMNQVWIVARALFAVRPVRLIIGKKARLYDSIIFSNVDSMSKVLKISQPSQVTDGKFEVTIFRRRNKLKLIMLLMSASIVGVTEDRQVKSFDLKTIKKTLVQIDGEIIALDPLSKVSIGIERQILNCII